MPGRRGRPARPRTERREAVGRPRPEPGRGDPRRGDGPDGPPRPARVPDAPESRPISSRPADRKLLWDAVTPRSPSSGSFARALAPRLPAAAGTWRSRSRGRPDTGSTPLRSSSPRRPARKRARDALQALRPPREGRRREAPDRGAPPGRRPAPPRRARSAEGPRPRAARTRRTPRPPPAPASPRSAPAGTGLAASARSRRAPARSSTRPLARAGPAPPPDRGDPRRAPPRPRRRGAPLPARRSSRSTRRRHSAPRSSSGPPSFRPSRARPGRSAPRPPHFRRQAALYRDVAVRRRATYWSARALEALGRSATRRGPSTPRS